MNPPVIHSPYPTPLNRQALLHSFQRASRRRIFLDYDGTLVDFTEHPGDAAPPAILLKTLERLAGAPETEVIIVSGRSRADLERWLGAAPGLWLAAEHGALLRPPDSAWRLPEGVLVEWKEPVRALLRHAVANTPGSFIEEKEYCLVWHFRASDPGRAEPHARELAARLTEDLSGAGICVIQGRKVIEIRLAALHKGMAVEAVARKCGPGGFWLAAGDDRTDEDLFLAAPAGSWTIRIGPGRSAARFALAGPAQMNAILRDLARLEPSSCCETGMDISPQLRRR